MWKTNLKVLFVALLVVGFYTGVAHIIPQLESEVPETLSLSADVTPEALVAAGEKIYAGAGGCTACHGLGTRAPNLLSDQSGEGTIGSRCGSRKPGMDCKAYLYESMINPGAHITKGFEPIMPDMRRSLSEEQIWATIAYLQSLGGEVTVTGSDVKSTAPVSTPGASVASGPVMSTTTDGKTLYMEKGCLGCHQLDKTGGVVGPSFDGMGSRLTADQIRRGILQPNADTAKGYEKFAGTMPATFGQQMTAAQLEALVAFIAARK